MIARLKCSAQILFRSFGNHSSPKSIVNVLAPAKNELMEKIMKTNSAKEIRELYEGQEDEFDKSKIIASVFRIGKIDRAGGRDNLQPFLQR